MVLLGVSFLGVESSLSRQARRLLYCGASSFVKRFCRCPSKSCLLIRMPNARKRLTTSSHNPICGNTPYGAFLRCQKRLSLSLIPARKDRNPLCRPQRLPLRSLRVFCGVSRRFPAGLPGFAIAWPEARTESPVFASGRRRSSCTANRLLLLFRSVRWPSAKRSGLKRSPPPQKSVPCYAPGAELPTAA